MMNDDDRDVIALGKATKRLMETEDYKKVIQDGYINSKLNALGRTFDASVADVDELKAIASLQQYLQTNIDAAEITVQSNSK